MTAPPLLSIVLPTYKEEGSIGTVLDDLARTLDAAGIHWEAIVVDDDSPDRTHDEVRERARRLGDRIRLVVRTDERGLASAVVRGFTESDGHYVAVMDADGQHPADAVARMAATAQKEEADVVVGSRHQHGGSVGGFGIVRRFVSWGAAALARILLPPVRKGRVTDPMSGLFLVRRRSIEGVDMDPRGYKILLEVLAKARPADGRALRVREVPYTFGSRSAGASKLGARVMLDYLLHLSALALRDPENRRLAKFALVGASGIAVNLFFVWIGGHFFGATGRVEPGTDAGPLKGLLALFVSGAIARELSVGWNFVANDIFTFHDKRHRTGHNMFMRFVRFNVVSLASFVVYSVLLLGLAYLGVDYLLAATVAILAGFVLNFKANVGWTYREGPGHAGTATRR